MGSIAVQLLKHFGAEPIVVTAGSNENAEYIQSHLGIRPEWVINYKNKPRSDLLREVKDVSSKNYLSATFDFVGGEMKKLAFEAVDAGGYVVSAVEEPSDFDLNLWEENSSPMVLKSLTYHFEQLGSYVIKDKPETWWTYHQDLTTLSQLIEVGSIRMPRIERMGSLSVDTVLKAHARLSSKHTLGKLIMVCE